jgi:hypothetical protein
VRCCRPMTSSASVDSSRVGGEAHTWRLAECWLCCGDVVCGYATESEVLRRSYCRAVSFSANVGAPFRPGLQRRHPTRALQPSNTASLGQPDVRVFGMWDAPKHFRSATPFRRTHTWCGTAAGQRTMYALPDITADGGCGPRAALEAHLHWLTAGRADAKSTVVATTLHAT